MPGLTSATGLIAARIRPIYIAKKKKVELYGSAKPAPFILRPFAGFFNPYPYGCSVLCNHPADCEAKEVVRRARESWATEGKALLLPVEVEMIRAGLVPVRGGLMEVSGGVGKREGGVVGGVDEGGSNICRGAPGADATSVPEELFRKYTDTDSRPLTPAPTLASGPSHARTTARDLTPIDPREKTTLVLDLRTKERDQESDILSWRALTLEPPPSSTRSRISVPRPIPRSSAQITVVPPPSPASLLPPVQINIAVPQSTDEYDETTSDEGPSRKKGKRKKKRKYRRGSTYGQQAEVRDPPEPSETLVSQNKSDSRRASLKPSTNEPKSQMYLEKASDFTLNTPLSSSFISADILKHLCRDLDREMIEWEFSLKRKVALEEALRIKKEMHASIRGSRQMNTETIPQNIPRVFSRQSARFEILDSQSLNKLTPLDYLSKHVYVTDGRKFIFSKVFNKFNEDSYDGVRYMLPNQIFEAIEEILGQPLTSDQMIVFHDILGEITSSLNFRTWCGICAFVERVFPTLQSRKIDPPDWIEWADFETLEKRLENACQPNSKLIKMLRLIKDK